MRNILAAAVILIAMVPTYKVARSFEPPRVCDFERGAWCLLNGSEQILFSRVPNQPLLEWRIFGQSWKDEPGIVLEPYSCKSAFADQISVISRERKFFWSKRAWRRVIVRLVADGSCDLQLLAPLEAETELDMARVILQTQIAACFSGVNCVDNVLAFHIEKPFKFEGLEFDEETQ